VTARLRDGCSSEAVEVCSALTGRHVTNMLFDAVVQR
jgi:hypothetical protein